LSVFSALVGSCACASALPKASARTRTGTARRVRRSKCMAGTLPGTG